MRKKLIIFGIFLIVFIITLSGSAAPLFQKEHSKNIVKNEWYYLPAYTNYAPQGLPDFDQKQDMWKGKQGIWRLIGGLWSFCGPTSVADIFWWFDSKHENQTGYPGDGNDTYPLVRDYHAPGTPTPGPSTDDHNFNNVNDLSTPWKQGQGAKELIENIAWYCNTNFCQYPFIRGFAGTYHQFLKKGVDQWILDAGLQDHYRVEEIENPDFSLIVERLQDNAGIIINLKFYNPNAKFFPTFLGHYVAVAGIHPDGYIALCDPAQNTMNPGPDPAAHNDANVVSYDIYAVNFTSPFPETASWWLPEYYDYKIIKLSGLAHYAMIISEIE